MARIGGSFPFNPAGSFVVALAGGQYFYPPAGSYLAAPITIATTVIQWWDPITGAWRNLATPHPISFDGYNFRVINTARDGHQCHHHRRRHQRHQRHRPDPDRHHR